MKITVNFEYQDKVIPIKVDEALVHLNNLTNMVCLTPSILENEEVGKQWDDAYDYLDSECLEAFKQHTEIEDVMVGGFLIPTEDDPSGLRVEILSI